MRVSYEIIAVLPDMSAETSVPPSMRDGVHVVHAPSGALTPVMWGAGLHVALGRVVAFTTAQMRVGVDWAPSLLRALDTRDDESIVGAGGPIELGTTDGAATDAAYFVRFSAFLPGLWNCIAPAADIPGDNAAYLRTALRQHEDLLTDGFWEVEFHRRFARGGRTLQMVPSAVATFTGRINVREMLAQRFAHAIEFGITRVARRGVSRLRVFVAAPLVPFVLLLRIVRRVAVARANLARLAIAMPWLVLFTGAWAVGEPVGAWRAELL